MSPTYKRLLVAVDAGLLLYWAAVFLNLIPEHLRFKDYSNQVIQAWNWSFFPLDVAAALTVFLGAHLTRVGSRIGDLVLTVGLMLTFCAGFMAISFWSFYRDFDPLWWGPNALLMIVPALHGLPAARGRGEPGVTVRDVLCPSTWASACRSGTPTGRTVLGALKDRAGATGHGVCAWPALGGAIVSEVSATLALRQALNHPGFYVMVGIGYALAFILLSLTLKAGMPLGVAYGLWGALGVALTAVLSMLVFGEPITVLVALGIALIMAGVLLVEVGAQHAGTQHKDGEAS